MAQMKLILREDVEKLGQAGDLVSVKPGYARNYLLPKGKASVATESRVRELEHHRRIIAEEQMKVLKDLEGVRKKVESLSLEVTAQAGPEGKLFGSVTTQQIAALLAEKGVEVDRRRVSTEEPIKTTGEHEVSVRLHREMVATVKVNVTASGVVATPEAEEPQDVERTANMPDADDLGSEPPRPSRDEDED